MLGYDVEIFEANGEKTISTSYPNIYILLAVKKFLRHFLKHSFNARVINYLIKDVLKNPALNADEVDHDMLKRLHASIDSCDIQIINMNAESDGRKCVLPDILPDIIPEIIYGYHT
jgi:hypothetical protein